MGIWIIALIAIIVAFLTIAAFVLPKFFLHNKCAVKKSADRGIKRTVDRDGESVLYEPSPRVKKYIKQYVLTCRDGEKSIVCKMNRRTKYADYDIVVFNSANVVKCILNVKEAVPANGYSHVVKLPDDTAYVSLNLNEANDKTFDSKVLSRVSAGRILLFVLISAILIALTVMGIRVCCAYLFGGLFREGLIYENESILYTGIIGAAVAAVDLVITLTAVLVKNYGGAGKKVKEE